MRRVIYVYYILLSFLFNACSIPDPGVKNTLQRAISLMNEHPDSAWMLLDTLQVSPTDKENYAEWCLRITQARDKDYQDHKSDSLINIATAYFENKADKEKQMLCYYYCGRVAQNMNDAPQAQDYYLKALNVGESSADYALLARINNNLGTLYTYQNAYELAFPTLHEAFVCLQQINDTIGQSFVLRNIGRIHYLQDQPDSAMVYYERALPYAGKDSKPSIFHELGLLHLEKEIYPAAYNYMHTSLQSMVDTRDYYATYLALGKYFCKTGNPDSARFYLQKSLESSELTTQSSSVYYLAELAAENKEWEKTVQFLKQHEILRDSVMQLKNKESIRKMQYLYDYQRAERLKNDFEREAQEKTVYFYRSGIALLLVVVGSCFLFIGIQLKRRREREQQEREKRIREQQYQKTELSVKDKEEDIKKLEELLLSERHVFQDMQKQLIVAKRQLLDMDKDKAMKQRTLGEDFYASSFYQSILSEAEKLDETDWKELSAWVDVMYSDFTQRLKNLYSGMTEAELRICYLIKIKIPVTRIAHLLCLTSQAISQTRKRLYKKLTGKDGGAFNMDAFLSDF